MRCTTGLFLLLAIASYSSFDAAAQDAATVVQRGIQLYSDADYAGATKAFESADKTTPGHPTILFDKACALWKQGDSEDATELFRDVATMRNTELAVESQYNLGSITVTQTKELLGETPETADKKLREQSLAELRRAVQHYRDCLQADPEHNAARHNLEVLRIWIHQLKTAWKNQDEQKADQPNPFKLLDQLESQQRSIREKTHEFEREPEEGNTPQRTEDVAAAELKLQEQITPLRDEIIKYLKQAMGPQQQPAPQPGSLPPVSSQPSPLDQATEAVDQVLQQSSDLIKAAGESLQSNTINDSLTAQSGVVQQTVNMFSQLAPFPNLVRKAVQQEELLVQSKTHGENSPSSRFVHDAAEQSLVSRISTQLKQQAEQLVKQMDHPPGNADPNQNQQLTQLKPAAEKTQELAPQIIEASNQAMELLDKGSSEGTQELQQQVLAWLKEIESLLPEDDQNPDQNNDDQQQDQDQQKNDQNDDQESQEEKKQQDKQSEEKQDDSKQQDDEKKDQKKQKNDPEDSKDDQESKNEEAKKQDATKPQSLSRHQAENLLRQVLERQQKYREQKKRLEQLIYGNRRVERDW